MAPRTVPSLSDHLRSATSAAHRRLESAVDMLAPPLSEDRFRRLLEAFHGFHAGWEPALLRQPALVEQAADRSKLPQLRADLRSLGASVGQIDALPVCAAAGGLAAEPSEALGSFYVMEGSTLGGQIIARALAAAPWRPAGGLRYFNPYGEATGRRWRTFKAWLDQSAAPADWPSVTAGAERTFDLLRVWLVEAETAAKPAVQAVASQA